MLEHHDSDGTKIKQVIDSLRVEAHGQEERP